MSFIPSNQSQIVIAPQAIPIIGSSPSRIVIQTSPRKIDSIKPSVENYNKVFDEQLNKKKAGSGDDGKCDILKWIIFLLPVILAIMCIFGAAFLINQNLKNTDNVYSAQRVLERVGKNLKKQPIQELASTEKGVECPSGFNQVQLGKWGGVKPGCLCEDKTEHDRSYCVFHSSCKFVREKDEKSLNYWFVSESAFLTKTVQVCAKTTKDFVLKNTQDTCPENHRQCGQGCVPVREGVACPLNHQEITTDTFTTSSRNIVQLNGSINKKFSAKTENDAKLPFVDFAITSGQGVCYDPKTAPALSSNSPYPYQRIKESGCKDNEIDTVDFEELDQNTEQQLFRVNDVQAIVDELPFKDKFYNPTDTFRLLVERRIHVDKKAECQNINTRSTDEMEAYARSTKNVLHGLAIAILVISCIIVLIAIIFIALKNHPKLREKNNPVKVIYILGIILLILCIVLGIVYLCKRDKLDETSAIYKKYVDKECFRDAPIKKACTTISEYANDVKERFSKYAQYFFISALVLILLGIILAVVRKGSQGGQLFEKPWE